MTAPFLVLDTETSGLLPATAGLVEVAAVLVVDGTLTAEFTSLCHPGEALLTSEAHVKALEISGITPAELDGAPTPAEALDSLYHWALKLVGVLPLPVTSYNTAFDRPFVEAHGPADRWRWEKCVMREARRVLWLSNWPRFPSLAGACQKLGIEREEAHRALGDAKDAARVMLALWERERCRG